MNQMIPLILATSILAFAGCSTLKKLRPETSLDEVPFNQLHWTYAGVDGSKAKFDKVTLSDLRTDARHCWYTWKVGLDAWGMAPTHADALACAFVMTPTGWKGGKFEWISTSRAMRELDHLTGGYDGWSLAGVPNPTEFAFVVITPDGRKRSNVITGTWKR